MRPYMRISEAGMISTTSISTRFVNPSGFSNGCAELMLKNPPPLVPKQLDRLLGGRPAPFAIVWQPPLVSPFEIR